MRLFPTFSLGLALFANLLSAQSPAQATLQVNNVQVVVNSNGSLFNDGQQGQFVPQETGLAPVTLLRSAGAWLAGLDPAGNLKGSIHRNSGSDFQPGFHPFSTEGAPPINKIWPVSCADVEQHLADFADNGVVDAPNAAIFAYPGSDNPSFEAYNNNQVLPATYGLGGFFDRNQDGIYTPAHGDYPVISIRSCPFEAYPEKMLWTALNDQAAHPSGLAPLDLELQSSVFAYKTTNFPELDNAIFVSYKIINRGFERLDSCFFGIYADFDIGNPNDDFFGCIPEKNVMYAYNGDSDDEGGFANSIPVMAVDMFRGPLDTFGSELGLAHAMTLPTAEGLTPIQIYNVLNGQFPDGSPAPNGGLMFPGNPANLNEVSEISAGSTPGQRVGVSSYGPFSLLPGAVNELIVGFFYTHAPGNTVLQNVQAVHNYSNVLQNAFDDCFANVENACSVALSAPEVLQKSDLRLSPNPTSSLLNVESKGEPFSRLELLNALGQSIRVLELGSPTQQHTLQVGDLPTGTYWLRVGAQALPVVIQR
jgi:hypothetical protein